MNPLPSSSIRRFSYVWWWMLGAVVLGFLAGVLIYWKLPDVLGRILVGEIEKAGVEDVQVDVDELSPFHVRLEAISFNRSPVTGVVGLLEATFDPLDLIQQRRAKTVLLDGVLLGIDLDQVAIPEGDGEPPILFPESLDQLPLDDILIRNGSLNLFRGDEGRSAALEALVESSGGTIAAWLTVTDVEGSQLLGSLNGSSGDGTLSVEGRIHSPLNWMPLLPPAYQLPAGLEIELAQVELNSISYIQERRLGETAATSVAHGLRVTAEQWQLQVAALSAGITLAGLEPQRVSIATAIEKIAFLEDWQVSPFQLAASVRGSSAGHLEAGPFAVSRGDAGVLVKGLKLSGSMEGATVTFDASALIEEPALQFGISGVLDTAEQSVDATLSIPEPVKVTMRDVAPWATDLPELNFAAQVSLDARAQISGGDLASAIIDGHTKLEAASFSYPLERLSLNGLSLNAGFSKAGINMNLTLPEGLTIDSIDFRDIRIRDLKTGALHMRYPGPFDLAGAEMAIMDTVVKFGRIQAEVQDKLPRLLEPLEIRIDQIDLARLLDLAPVEGWRVAGLMDLYLALSQGEDSPLPYGILGRGMILAPSVTVISPAQDLEARLYDFHLDLDLRNELSITTARPFKLRSFRMGKTTFSGEALVLMDAAVLNPAETQDGAEPDLWAKGTVRLFGGRLEQDLILEGIGGELGFGYTEGSYELGSLGDLKIERIEVGDLAATNIVASGRVTPNSIVVDHLTADFMGGQISVEDVEGTVADVSLTLRFEGIDSAQVARLMPNFEGGISGPLDGFVRVRRYNDNQLRILSGRLALREGKQGLFSYPEPEEILGQPEESEGGGITGWIKRKMEREIRTKTEMALGNFRLERLVITFSEEGWANIFMAGRGVDRGTPALELNITPRGDLAGVIELILNNRFSVNFD